MKGRLLATPGDIMEAVSILYDERINAHNVLFSMTVGEYLDSVGKIRDRNPFQRRRISASKTVYSLLKRDLEQGCVIPAIVLALNDPTPRKTLSKDEAIRLVTDRVADLLILDGLQRTNTLMEATSGANSVLNQKVRGMVLRVEIYIGLNRIGILYRMLTLNTGQTPMSLRQQIEMLYYDYLNTGLEDITFVREVDEQHATLFTELNFKDTIEGFNSYLERNELPLDRSDLLENVKSLENLSHENSKKDLFKDYVLSWLAFLRAVERLCGNTEVDSDQFTVGAAAWGKTAMQVFKKPQVQSGFGAALGKLKDFELIRDVDEVQQLSKELSLGESEADDFLLSMNKEMAWITTNTKKIGSAQRMFFLFYFRDVFNRQSDSYLNLSGSIASARHKLQSQLM
jgi:hypothetical protein